MRKYRPFQVTGAVKLARESRQTIEAVLGIPADVEARLPRALVGAASDFRRGQS